MSRVVQQLHNTFTDPFASFLPYVESSKPRSQCSVPNCSLFRAWSLEFLPWISSLVSHFIDSSVSNSVSRLVFVISVSFFYLGFYLLSHHRLICHFHLEFWVFRPFLSHFVFSTEAPGLPVSSSSRSVPTFFSTPQRNTCLRPLPFNCFPRTDRRYTLYPLFQSKNTLHRLLSIYTRPKAWVLALTSLRNKIFYGTLLFRPTTIS